MKAISFTVGKYTLMRDERGNWTRTIPPEEMIHPKGFKEYALTPFEEALAEEILQVKSEIKVVP